ncbi:hypothetical protein, partial [Burkholderia gladioli]|uniref:hypothetical protein n=1 Tax=Burkholderia gladioli TaxID=28095 RepID=UPI003F7982F6
REHGTAFGAALLYFVHGTPTESAKPAPPGATIASTPLAARFLLGSCTLQEPCHVHRVRYPAVHHR